MANGGPRTCGAPCVGLAIAQHARLKKHQEAFKKQFSMASLLRQCLTRFEQSKALGEDFCSQNFGGANPWISDALLEKMVHGC